MQKRAIDCFLLFIALFICSAGWAEWKPHVVRQLNGRAGQIKLPGKFQIVTASWNNVVYVPYLVYMPEKDRLLLLASYGDPHQATVITSDDRGATWSQRKYVHTDAAGKPDTGVGVSLTYLGKGKVLLVAGEGISLWFSKDYGETWGDQTPLPPGAGGEPFYMWDPVLVDKDPQTGSLVRLVATGWRPVSVPGKPGGEPIDHAQGQIRSSTDEGRTWSKAVIVPAWLGWGEIALVRAKNGNLVTACRSDPPMRFRKMEFDHYCGLGVSISNDNGKTWSKVNVLYEWGRHHPSMVLLPSGDIVMTYVVRLGYPITVEGYPQWGIEAVVSHDSGQSWDLDHRYLLVTWRGNEKGPGAWIAGSQATSTVLLPDGSLLTAFGTGYRALNDPSPRWRTAMDVGLVSWNVNQGKVNSGKTIANAPFDSNLRNEFDPNPPARGKATPAAGERNIAVAKLGARVRASASDEDPNLLLYDPYAQPVVTLQTMPAWVELTWPKAHRIDEIRIHPGAPCLPRWPQRLASQSTPAEYRLQYQKGGNWVDLLPPVTHALPFSEFSKTAKPEDEFQYVHRFAPVKLKAIRLFITRSGDPGTRGKSGAKVVVPEDKRETVLRRIDVFEAKHR